MEMRTFAEGIEVSGEPISHSDRFALGNGASEVLGIRVHAHVYINRIEYKFYANVRCEHYPNAEAGATWHSNGWRILPGQFYLQRVDGSAATQKAYSEAHRTIVDVARAHCTDEKLRGRVRAEMARAIAEAANSELEHARNKLEDLRKVYEQAENAYVAACKAAGLDPITFEQVA